MHWIWPNLICTNSEWKKEHHVQEQKTFTASEDGHALLSERAAFLDDYDITPNPRTQTGSSTECPVAPRAKSNCSGMHKWLRSSMNPRLCCLGAAHLVEILTPLYWW